MSVERQARVLFLCMHNSARSQMAEGLLRSMAGDRIEVWSAGSEPRPVQPCAVEALVKLGIDISGQSPKHLDEVSGQAFDFVITLCDEARESCPVFPDDPERIHWGFPDPSATEAPPGSPCGPHEDILPQLSRRLRLLLTIIERERK